MRIVYFMYLPYIATFSIVARDPHNGDLAVAVQSKFLAVGSVVGWAQAGAGVLATQALANVGYGPQGLALLSEGKSAQEVVAQLTSADAERDQRQLGVVDREGRAAAWTGSGCHAWAGHTVGSGFSCQGNILAGPTVTEAMAATFIKSSGEVAERCVAALAAGQAAGGDRRGRQSAALYVARDKGSYGGLLDRYIDLRVDDHVDPIPELERLLKLHRFYLTRPPATAYRPITPAIASELQDLLRDLGYYDGPTTGTYDEVTQAALFTMGGFENLEERLVEDARIDSETLTFLRAKRASR